MSAWRSIMAGLVMASLMAGCSSSKPEPTSASKAQTSRARAEGFDEAKARAETAGAVNARQIGDAIQARAYAEAAVAHWPGTLDGWSELAAACHAAADRICERHAQFFHDKVEFLNSQPPRMAVLGLQNLLEDEPATKVKSATGAPAKAKDKDKDEDDRIDPWTIATAQHMMAFYDQQDPGVAQRSAPVGELVSDQYPPGTVAAIGAGAIATGLAISKFK